MKPPIEQLRGNAPRVGKEIVNRAGCAVVVLIVRTMGPGLGGAFDYKDS